MHLARRQQPRQVLETILHREAQLLDVRECTACYIEALGQGVLVIVMICWRASSLMDGNALLVIYIKIEVDKA